jgi:tyrosine decarboxylase / aspartate 1-decarboxylase
VLQLPFEAVRCDGRGRMDLEALKKRLAQGDVGTVVATMGTTATGSVDALKEILELRREHGFRVHADAAYGGYFGLAGNLTEQTRVALECVSLVDSIVIDPHKHGLQPYGCGCVIFRDPGVGRLYKHESPYTYFSSKELHLGEISLECSRAGASAVALWATQKLLPLEKDGEFAKGLESCREAALDLHRRLKADKRFIVAFPPELDIVVFAPRTASAGESSALTRRIFEAAAKRNLHLAVAALPTEFFAVEMGAMKKDRPTLSCLRSVLMKPEHREWVGRIWTILDEAMGDALSS